MEDVDDNAKLFEQLSTELSEVNVKYTNMNETNQTLHQMLDELHEASSNEIKVLKLEIEALRADKAVKDEQLNMLYTVMEHHLGINVQAVYNNLEIQRVEERRAQREKELAEAATEKKKDVIVETQEAGGSSSQPEGDIEMVDAENAEVENMEVDQAQGFILVGDSVSLSYSFDDIIRLFDIEDEIPSSPEKDYELKYANEADNFDHVEVDECSDISEEDTPFHYSSIDDTFPTLAEMFKEQNEDEIRRKVVGKITTEGNPKVVPHETLIEGRKNWFKVMPKERKFKRPLQYFTHSADISLGDILSWGYLEDLQVYAIRREKGVQYFEFLSDIQTLPWWDVEELMQTKNIKQFYYGLNVNQHD
ncbi:hypothetical protein Hanom_Chr15g01395171 [Helianthus anomalus]